MANRRLGQHWLHDPGSLYAVAEAAGVTSTDTVLEIGPGLGTLTEVLIAEAKQVVAVELDGKLAAQLKDDLPAANLQVVHQDILQFDLSTLPPGYKVAANIPYYITSPIVMRLLESEHKPAQLGLLVQKEVAQRMGASAGDLSVLGVAAQALAKVEPLNVVPAHFFKPPPKVDSQILQLIPHKAALIQPFDDVMKLVKAGFLNRRKTLANSLASTLGKSKTQIAVAINGIGLPANIRAQELSLEKWQELYDLLKI